MGAMQACGAGCHGRIAIQPLRSFLFAPGNHARRVEKALSLQADAVILDLEDAVATAEKRTTRDAVIAALTRPRRPLLYVRVNAVDTEFCYGDLAAIVRPGLDGIILPKVESAGGLATVDWLIEREHCEPNLAGIRSGLSNWPAGTSAAQRKLRLFDDRLIDLALDRIAPATSEKVSTK